MSDELFGSGSEPGTPEAAQSPRSDSDIERSPSPPPKKLKVKDVALPRYAPSHESEQVYLSRVPAFIGLEPEPFDAVKTGDAVAAGEDLDENAVRWKYGRTDDGKVTKLSNARVVEWSDGTRSLQLGTEHFEMRLQKPYEPTFITTNYAQQRILQTTHMADEIVTIIPTSTSSATHKRLAQRLASRQQSGQVKIGNVATTEDPEKIQREVERVEMMKERARRKLDAQRESLVRSTSSSYRSASPAQRYDNLERQEELDDDDMDEDEEEDEEVEDESEEPSAEESGADGLDSDDLEALDDEADEANASRLQAVKDAQEEDSKPVQRTRVLEDSDDD